MSVGGTFVNQSVPWSIGRAIPLFVAREIGICISAGWFGLRFGRGASRMNRLDICIYLLGAGRKFGEWFV